MWCQLEFSVKFSNFLNTSINSMTGCTKCLKSALLLNCVTDLLVSKFLPQVPLKLWWSGKIKFILLKFHGKTCFPAYFLFGNYFVIFCVCSWVSVKSWYCRKPRLSYWIVKANQNKINLNFLVQFPSLYIMLESDPGNFADGSWSSFSLQEICLLSSC